ncbi:DUF3891 family protein [Halobacillus amylolyticus]|uniref:DUF3891 family protein n=1 Tax=Halobacillus amylolyticus TaxID=2932259 RepID=A0ABY4H765_9BACI|nr:DUF3891 family protein [Halobacillus amylolyticus]UOR10718.1 DUF3891 family protein [Halobacillus amylolyticus]
MIVQQQGDQFLMIKQHDHALLSGKLAIQWKQKFLLRSKLREEADWAVGQHDRAWIPLDDKPSWNKEKQRPYTFIDYPLEEKLAAYQRGIKEVSEESKYGGMLCSLHYQSFFSKDSEDDRIVSFIEGEEKRRVNLAEEMKMEVPKDLYHTHFERLQFCDDLSLYVCMQEPGVAKENEMAWFREGFSQRFDVAPGGVMPYWVDTEHVSLDPFPFESSFEVTIPYRTVSCSEVEQIGLADAFSQAELRERTVTFIQGE